MAKTLTIEIKSMGEALEGFRKAFKALETGRRVARHEGVYFTSIEAARNLLTRNRLALLRAIRAQRSSSIYELAKAVKRDLQERPAGPTDLRGVRADPDDRRQPCGQAPRQDPRSTLRRDCAQDCDLGYAASPHPCLSPR
jgi:hypothetical protein